MCVFRAIESIQKHLSGTGADFHGKKIFARNLIFSTPTFWPGAVEISTGRRNFDRVAEIPLFLRLTIDFFKAEIESCQTEISRKFDPFDCVS